MKVRDPALSESQFLLLWHEQGEYHCRAACSKSRTDAGDAKISETASKGKLKQGKSRSNEKEVSNDEALPASDSKLPLNKSKASASSSQQSKAKQDKASVQTAKSGKKPPGRPPKAKPQLASPQRGGQPSGASLKAAANPSDRQKGKAVVAAGKKGEGQKKPKKQAHTGALSL